MLELRNITHHYYQKKLIFSDLSYTFNSGGKFIIYGDNGIGKTTLLKIISHHLTPSQGEIIHPQKIKMLFFNHQYQALFPRLTLQENINYFAPILKIDTIHIKKHLTLWKELPLFSEILTTPYYKLSTGMQKLALFCTLTIPSPEIILADELFENLSDESTKWLSNYLKLRHHQATIIITAHHNIQLPLETISLKLENKGLYVC